jgi:hypothetical protein
MFGVLHYKQPLKGVKVLGVRSETSDGWTSLSATWSLSTSHWAASVATCLAIIASFASFAAAAAAADAAADAATSANAASFA